jgi:hypothetical protein
VPGLSLTHTHQVNLGQSACINLVCSLQSRYALSGEGAQLVKRDAHRQAPKHGVATARAAKYTFSLCSLAAVRYSCSNNNRNGTIITVMGKMSFAAANAEA